jgi:hypothetical protein
MEANREGDSFLHILLFCGIAIGKMKRRQVRASSCTKESVEKKKKYDSHKYGA